MGESLIISDEQPRHRIRRTWQEECGKCVPVLNCVAILPFHPEKNRHWFFFPSQLISHNLQFSNTKRIQLQKDHSFLGQGIYDFPSRIGKSHVGLWAAQRQDSLGLPVWYWFQQRSHFLSPTYNALSWTADAIDHVQQNTNTLWPLLNRNASA